MNDFRLSDDNQNLKLVKETPIITVLQPKSWGFLPLPTELADGLRLEGVSLLGVLSAELKLFTLKLPLSARLAPNIGSSVPNPAFMNLN
ncbi:hypothetical protein CK516_14800 [Nostoc sp. 'Peltigera malacea cyanobiont' DB3992]|nr:hypothetical protein CK516_14800 [Nostoc sp. 'Peltigera malacea cyanobiont' DB3992]